MNDTEPDDKSRRSFMKKGALASGAAALGLTSSGSVTGETNLQQAPDTGLTFVNDYRPGVPFQVVSRIQQTTVNRILGAGQDGQPVSDPTDYDGFIYNYQGCGAGDYNLVFVREATLQQDQTYSFTDATFFSETIQLLEAGVQRGGGAAAGNQTAGGNQTSAVGDAVSDS